jgi:hypothetical protein
MLLVVSPSRRGAAPINSRCAKVRRGEDPSLDVETSPVELWLALSSSNTCFFILSPLSLCRQLVPSNNSIKVRSRIEGEPKPIL